jgi:hypothetical protein
MSYIKISDPNIIDIAAWHQVINVVNQHSDSLASITNNFGISSTVDWNTNLGFSHQFDSGTQAIIFGRAGGQGVFTPDNATTPTVYYNQVTFADTNTGVNSFAATPVVTATVFTGNPSGGAQVGTTLDDLVLQVYNVTPTSFYYRLFRTGTNKAIGSTLYVYVNWMAIGPRQ